MKNAIILLFVLLIYGISSCVQPRKTVAAYQNMEVQFIRIVQNEKICIKVFAKGNNRKECIEQAKIDAVKAVVFDGIRTAPDSRPLYAASISEIKVADFFENFFNENGSYKEYVTLNNGGNISRDDQFNLGDKTQIGVELIVDRKGLRNHLINASILK